MAESMLLLRGPWDGKVLTWHKGELPDVLHTSPVVLSDDPDVLIPVVSHDDYARTGEKNDADQWVYEWLEQP